MNSHDVATSAVLALLFEVSANPKSGNVDRDHNFEDLKYEDFLASSVASYRIFLRAAEKIGSIGDLVLDAIIESSRWHKAKNVHFGAFLLLIPLAYSSEAKDAEEMSQFAVDNLKQTSYNDSISVFKAFKICNARVMRADKLSLEDDYTIYWIKKEKINLYEWMLMAPKENLNARELIEGYKISLDGMKEFTNKIKEFKDINVATVLTYHYLLSKYPDTLVIAKHGREIAEKVMAKSKQILDEFNGDLSVFKSFDEELISKGINPGAIADITCTSIFLALIEGVKF